jgi:hypothetical protein
MQVVQVQNSQSKLVIILQKDCLQVASGRCLGNTRVHRREFVFLKNLVDAINLIQGKNLQIEEQWKIT